MGSYLDLDDVAAGHPKAEHELHLMREHIKGLESALEELETLRASNRIKQANIELLEAENEKLEDKLQEQLCTVGSLLEENAKLIADQSVNLNSLAKSFGDEFIVDPEYYYISNAIEHLIKDRLAMQAEREAMMKQEPYGYIFENKDTNSAEFSFVDWDHFKGKEFPVFKRPLPAQQIPEGYAKIPEEVSHHDALHYGETDWCRGYNACISDMLSARQPKEYEEESSRVIVDNPDYEDF